MEPIVSPLDKVLQILPYLAPIILLQLILAIICLVDLARREMTRGPKWLWVLLVIFIQMLGPLAYLIIGRKE